MMSEHTTTTAPSPSPWLTPQQAAERAQCGPKTIHAAIKAGRLKAARLGVRKDTRIHVDWLDAWIEASIVLVNPHAPGAPRPMPVPRRGPSKPVT